MPEASSRIARPFLPSWRSALGDKSGVMFAEMVAPHVRLEGSIYATPVDGRDKVWTCMRTAAGFTDTLSFTRESTSQDRSYLEAEMGRRLGNSIGPDVFYQISRAVDGGSS